LNYHNFEKSFDPSAESKTEKKNVFVIITLLINVHGKLKASKQNS